MNPLTVNPPADREDAAINGMNAALGVILLISPWLLGFGGAGRDLERRHRRRRQCGRCARRLHPSARMGGVGQPRGRAVRCRFALAHRLHPLRPRRGRISPSGCRSPCWRPSSFGGFTERRPRVAPERAGERAGTVRVLPSSGSRPRASAARAVKRHTW